MKVTIDVREGIEPNNAVYKVARVIESGLISQTRQVPQYCFVTTFMDGTRVIARPRKATTSAHSFIVERDK
jgi:hypothetical protein